MADSLAQTQRMWRRTPGLELTDAESAHGSRSGRGTGLRASSIVKKIGTLALVLAASVGHAQIKDSQARVAFHEAATNWAELIQCGQEALFNRQADALHAAIDRSPYNVREVEAELAALARTAQDKAQLSKPPDPQSDRCLRLTKAAEANVEQLNRLFR